MAELSRPRLVLCGAAWAATEPREPAPRSDAVAAPHSLCRRPPPGHVREPAGGGRPPPGASHTPQAGPRPLGWGSLYAVILKCYFKEIL